VRLQKFCRSSRALIEIKSVLAIAPENEPCSRVKLLAGPKNYESSLCAERKRARRKPLFLFLAGDKYQFCKQMKWNPGALLKTLLTRDSACKLELLPRAPFESHFFAIHCVCVCVFFSSFSRPRKRAIHFHFDPRNAAPLDYFGRAILLSQALSDAAAS
jgi:hypothetical protein